jgi:hypothetical protein
MPSREILFSGIKLYVYLEILHPYLRQILGFLSTGFTMLSLNTGYIGPKQRDVGRNGTSSIGYRK